MLDSLKKRGLFFQHYKVQVLARRTQKMLSEVQRQNIKMQGIEHLPEVFKVPFDDRLPAVFATLYMVCDNEYKCKGCKGLNTCFNKAVERIRQRAGRKLQHDVSDFEMLAGAQRLGMIDTELRNQLQAVMLDWE